METGVGGEHEDVRRMTIRIPLSMVQVPNSREVFKIKVAPATYATGATLPRDRIELPTRGFSGRSESAPNNNSSENLAYLEVAGVAKSVAELEGSLVFEVSNNLAAMALKLLAGRTPEQISQSLEVAFLSSLAREL